MGRLIRTLRDEATIVLREPDTTHEAQVVVTCGRAYLYHGGARVRLSVAGAARIGMTSIRLSRVSGGGRVRLVFHAPREVKIECEEAT